MSLPSWAYRDPALIVESEELKQKNCTVCVHAQVILGRHICTNNLKFPACRPYKNGFKVREGQHGKT